MIMCFAINNFCAGGAERVLSLIVNYYAANCNFETHVICFGNDAEYARFYPLNRKINIHYINFNDAEEQLVQVLKEIKPDFVASFLNPMNYVVSLATRKTHIPHVACERNNPLHSPDNETERRKRDEAFKAAAGCVFQTNLAAEYFRGKIHGIYRIIHNPVSIDAKYCDYQERQDKFVAVGRYAMQKNYPLLLESFKQFTFIYPKYKLEVYGKDSGCFQQIAQIVDSLSLNNNVSLNFETRQIHQHIRTAKAYISTSLYEGIPNALSEAVALGIPCIATDIPGSHDILKKYNSGILVQANNPDEFIKAMCRVQSKDVFMELTRNREKILSENSVEIVATSFLEFFNSVVNKVRNKRIIIIKDI